MLIAIKYWEVKPFIVSNTDYRNTFMNVQGIAGYNTFFNAVAFETGESDFFQSSDDTVMLIIDRYSTNNLKINGKPFEDYPNFNNSGVSMYTAFIPKYSVIKATTLASIKVSVNGNNLTTGTPADQVNGDIIATGDVKFTNVN